MKTEFSFYDTTRDAALGKPGSEQGSFDHPNPPVVFAAASLLLVFRIFLVIFDGKFYAGFASNFFHEPGRPGGSSNGFLGDSRIEPDVLPDVAIRNAIAVLRKSYEQNANIKDKSFFLDTIDKGLEAFEGKIKKDGRTFMFPGVTKAVPAAKAGGLLSRVSDRNRKNGLAELNRMNGVGTIARAANWDDILEQRKEALAKQDEGKSQASDSKPTTVRKAAKTKTPPKPKEPKK